MTRILSNCCGAAVRVEGHTTQYYVCRNCECACDASLIAELENQKSMSAPDDVYQDKQNQKWYYRDETGLAHGPYPNEQKAQKAYTRYLEEARPAS